MRCNTALSPHGTNPTFHGINQHLDIGSFTPGRTIIRHEGFTRPFPRAATQAPPPPAESEGGQLIIGKCLSFRRRFHDGKRIQFSEELAHVEVCATTGRSAGCSSDAYAPRRSLGKRVRPPVKPAMR